MKFEGEFVDIMCQVNPEYETFVTYEKGKKVLYVLILKVVYGMIESALLWYFLFSTTLSYFWFKLKPYEQCITNKVIDEQEVTIRWFVDDNKVSHMDENVNSMISEKLKKKLGNYISQQERSTGSLVWTLSLLAERELQCPHHITLMRL